MVTTWGTTLQWMIRTRGFGLRASPDLRAIQRMGETHMGVRNSLGGVPERSVAAAVSSVLRGGFSRTLGTCLLAASAHGAETTPAAKSDGLEEVIVTGIRQSLE